jgi:transposase
MSKKIKIDKEEINNLIENGNSVKEIAKKLNVSVSTIQRFLVSHNIKMPTYIQSNETKNKRSVALKEAHKKDLSLAIRKTEKVRERSKQIKNKTLIEIYGNKKKVQQILKKARLNRLGKKLSFDTIDKIRKGNTGKKMTQKSRKKLSDSRKKGFKDGSIKLSSKCGCGKGGYKKDIGHYIRSTYEHYFAQELIRNNISYFYEPKTFSIIVNGNKTTFTPDFFIIQSNKFIEIKNAYNVNDKFFKQKFDAFINQYPYEKIEIIVGDRNWIPTTPLRLSKVATLPKELQDQIVKP